AAGQIDGGSTVKIQIDVGSLSGNDGANDARDIAARQIMGFQAAGGNAGVRIGAHTGLHGHDFGLNDDAGIDFAQAHANQTEQADTSVGHVGLKPELAIGEHQHQEN